jgi:hypothetical protein
MHQLSGLMINIGTISCNSSHRAMKMTGIALLPITILQTLTAMILGDSGKEPVTLMIPTIEKP